MLTWTDWLIWKQNKTLAQDKETDLQWGWTVSSTQSGDGACDAKHPQQREITSPTTESADR